MNDLEVSKTLDELIRSTDHACPSVVLPSKATATLQPFKLPPIHAATTTSSFGGFSKYKTRSRNGSTSQGSRREDPFNSSSSVSSSTASTTSTANSNGIKDSINKLKLAFNAKTSTLESLQINDNSKSIELMKEILKVRSQNSLLKNDIWNSLSNLSLNTSENIPIDEDEVENSDDSDDDAWGNDEYVPKINSTTFNKSYTNDDLKRILSDYKSYNTNLSSTIDDYNQSLESIMNHMVQMHCSLSNDLNELINDSQLKVQLENERTAMELDKSVNKLSDLGLLGTQILNKFNDL